MRLFWPRFERRKAGRKTFSGRYGNHLLAALILVITVLSGFFLSFPNRALQHRIEQEIGNRLGAPVQTERAYLRFPARLEIERLTTSAPLSLPLQIDTLQLSPIWMSLFKAQPGCNFTVTSGDGTIVGQLSGAQRLTADIAAIPLSLPLPGMSSLTLAGTLSSGAIDAPLALSPDPTARVELTVDDLNLSGLEPLTGKSDTLALGQLHLSLKGTAGNYRIEQLQLTGGAITADGTLIITPAASPAASRLNGTLSVQPTDGLAPEIAALLPLLGRADRSGKYQLRLSGTLAAPRLR